MRMPSASRWAISACTTLMLVRFAAAPPARAQCLGDCNGDGEVRIDELITAVNVALGNVSSAACPAFACEAGPPILISCLVAAVDNALVGCTTPTPTPVATCTSTATVPPLPTLTPTVTGTPTRTCAAPPTPPDCPAGEGAADCRDPQCFVECGCGTVTPTATPTNSCTPGGGHPPPGCQPEGPTSTITPPCHLPTPTATGTETATSDAGPTTTPPPSRCRTSADCASGGALCLEVGGFAGCGICYPDDVIDTDFRRCSTDIDCAPEICEPLGPASHTCSPCSGPALVCVEGCGDDFDCEPGYLCRAARCQPPACEGDGDCPAQHACTAGTCQRRLCTTDAPCGGGACVNGACRAELGNCTFPPP